MTYTTDLITLTADEEGKNTFFIVLEQWHADFYLFPELAHRTNTFYQVH